MSGMVDIDEGNTNSYVLHAFVVLLVSIPSFMIHPIVGGVIVIIGLSIFATRNGIQIDLKNNRYRKYANYMGWKIGNWEVLKNVAEARIVLSSENALLNSAMAFPRSSVERSAVDIKTLTYDLVLSNGEEEEIILYEFLSYKDAKRALNAFTEKGITTVDQIKNKLAQNQRRRRR